METTIRPGFKPLLKVFSLMTLPIVVIVAFTAPAALIPTLAFTSLSVIFLRQVMAVKIVVDDNRLNIRALSCSFGDKLDNFEPSASKKFSFKQDEQLGLKKRFLGADLEGFHVGWFGLAGGDVGFACLTRKERARTLKTRDGYHLLLDPSLAKKVERYLG